MEVKGMRFDKDKKNAIVLYILEKINENVDGVSRHVSEELNVNQSTVHRYINELLVNNVIEKEKHGKYRLVTHVGQYQLSRAEGDLESDMIPFNQCLLPHISHLSLNVQQIWTYVFSEMINNVMDHSEATKAIIKVTQDYLNTTVILIDNGVGVFKKIQDHFGYSSIDDSIIELFKGKLTTDSVNHSGEGIFFSSRMMDRFYIISSKKIFTCNQFDDETVYDLAERTPEGTCILMSLSNYSAKNLQDIFDKYADVNGGFTKTIIPMKNIFDSPPVSRSQAKRLSNRLDRFVEVDLDFSGISWMGQGFAHQLFVVFQAEHPNIKINPVYMDEKVSRMYMHVING